MRILLFGGVLLLFMPTVPALAANGQEDRGEDPKICKMVKVPGNRTKTRVCQRQSFWDEQMEIEKAAASGGKVDYQQRQHEE